MNNTTDMNMGTDTDNSIGMNMSSDADSSADINMSSNVNRNIDIEGTKIPILCGQMLTTAMFLTSIGLAVPYLSEDVKLTIAERGFLFSSQFLGATIAVFVGGALCRKYGDTFISKIAMFMAACCAAMFGVVWNYPSALTVAFLLGASSLVLENAIMSTGMKLGDKSRFANSIIQASFSAGAVLLPLLFLFWRQFGVWRPVYFCIAALFLIGFVFSRGKIQKPDGESIGGLIIKYGSFFKKKSFLLGPMMVLLYVSAEIGLWSFAPTFFESMGYGELSQILSALLVWVMVFVGRVICTALIRKTSMMRILIPFGVCGTAAYVCIMVFSGGAPLFFVAVAGFACAPFYSFLTSLSTEVSGDNSSTYIAFTMGMGTLGPTLTGGIGGVAGETLGPRFVLLPSMVCFCALVSILIIFNAKQTRLKRYATHDVAHNATHDATHDVAHNATHDIAHNATNNATHGVAHNTAHNLMHSSTHPEGGAKVDSP